MNLTFLGTSGNTKIRSRIHRRHSALLAETGAGRVMFDCGEDWLRRVFRVAPDAIVLTHAHPDHAFGLREGAPCPVYATAETWKALSHYPVADKRTLSPARAVRVHGLSIRAFPVIHSILAPAVGYRVADEGATFFYAPDIVAIEDPKAALARVDVYIGDGATPTRPMVRRHDSALFGHTTIRAQIGWCAKAGVPRAIFTHCGSAIIRADGRTAAAAIRRMGRERGVDARIATDGLRLTLP